jgi:ribosome biogenesis GTPase
MHHFRKEPDVTHEDSTTPGPDIGPGLRTLGADDERVTELTEALVGAGRHATIARVVRVDRGRFQALIPLPSADSAGTGIDPGTGTVSIATTGVSPVCVGDWCTVTLGAANDDPSTTLIDVHRRRTALVRQSSGQRTEVQALAANIDVVMVIVPLDRAISVRQIERFLALAWDSGAAPVVVLTKLDLVDPADAASAAAEVATVSGDLPVLTVSVVNGAGMDTVADFVRAGVTVALLGTSGSGKSSLVNALMGADVVQTGEVRASDAKGKHTTTWREMLIVPSGGVLIDTPGLRELGMWVDEEGIDAAFADITDLESLCRFTDCAHDSEPDCAVLAAIAAGTLDPERLVSYRKLLAEAAYAARKNDHRLAKETQKMWKQRQEEGRRKARP